jgi:hypothetical protein
MFRRLADYAALVSILFLAASLHAQTTATLTPSSFNFGTQVENTTSSPEVFTLKNTGSHQLTSISISISGAYAQTHTCGTTLASGATCTISVTFTPTGTGPFSGTLTVTDSATNSPQKASLSGTGILPVTLTPGSINFGNQAIDTTSPSQQFTLKNNQTVTLTINGVRVASGFAQTNTCGTSLGAGHSCTINVTFSPTTATTYSGTVSVSDNASNSPQAAGVSGTGVVDVSLSPASLAFGNQAINSNSPTQTVTVTNNETTSVSVTNVQVPAGFSQTNTCTTLTGLGSTCSITVTFSPTSLTTYSGNLSVTDSAATGSPQSIPLSGTGINPAVPASFFAMDVNQNNVVYSPNNPHDYWPGTSGTGASGVSFGTYRTLGSAIKWADVYDCSANGGLGEYTFNENASSNNLQAWASVSADQKMMFTAYYTPKCLSQYPNDSGCAFASQTGGCDLPGDVFTPTSCPPYGTIEDCTWVTFITQLATYMNNNFPGQLGYIEVWNEPNNQKECNSNTGNCTAASLAQMVADAKTYAQAINSNIKIISPAVTGVLPPTGEDCTQVSETINSYLSTLLGESPSVFSNANFIGFHGYSGIPALGGSSGYDPAAGASCEANLIASVQSVVTGASSTPIQIYDTEGSWGTGGNAAIQESSYPYQNQAEEAAFTGAYYLIQASNTVCSSTPCDGMAGFSWYGWDFDNQGTDPGSTGQFWDQWTSPSGALTQAGTTYEILYSWLNGASPVGPCNLLQPVGSSTVIGVWTCQFEGSGSAAGLAVWDNSQSCLNITSQCQYTHQNWSIPSNLGAYTEWRDLFTGAVTSLNGATSVNIGLVPILLDNGTVPGAQLSRAKKNSTKAPQGKAR